MANNSAKFYFYVKHLISMIAAGIFALGFLDKGMVMEVSGISLELLAIYLSIKDKQFKEDMFWGVIRHIGTFVGTYISFTNQELADRVLGAVMALVATYSGKTATIDDIESKLPTYPQDSIKEEEEDTTYLL